MTRFCLALPTLALGCGGSLPGRCEDGSCGNQSSWRTTFQTTVNRKIDVLFVVDDTPAIAPHAAALAPAYPVMAQALEWLPLNGPASLHVGFIGAGGCKAGTRGSACGLASSEQFMRAEWCETKTNFASTFGGTFACLADLGAADCAPAQLVAAALSLLGGPPPEGWEGFLRSDASLMIVIVAAGDDASGAPGQLTPVPALAAQLRSLKPDPSRIMLSVVGPKDCSTGELQAPRLRELAVGFGENGAYRGLCDRPIADALARIADRVSVDRQWPCLISVRDTDLDRDGLQADCTFQRWTPSGSDGNWTATTLPSCDDAPPPCGRLTPSGPGCGAGYAPEIERGPNWCDDGGMTVTVECLGCADANDPACAPQP